MWYVAFICCCYCCCSCFIEVEHISRYVLLGRAHTNAERQFVFWPRKTERERVTEIEKKKDNYTHKKTQRTKRAKNNYYLRLLDWKFVRGKINHFMFFLVVSVIYSDLCAMVGRVLCAEHAARFSFHTQTLSLSLPHSHTKTHTKNSSCCFADIKCGEHAVIS